MRTAADERSDLATLLNLAACKMRSAQIDILLAELKYRPDQPRVPRGHRHGGRWVSEGGRNVLRPGASLIGGRDDRIPDLPNPLPQRPRDRHTLAKQLAAELIRRSPQARAAILVLRVGSLLREGAYDIVSYFDSPMTLEELFEASRTRKLGYDGHHINEQAAARAAGFPESRIQAPDNIVQISRFKHWEISGWYSR